MKVPEGWLTSACRNQTSRDRYVACPSLTVHVTAPLGRQVLVALRVLQVHQGKQPVAHLEQFRRASGAAEMRAQPA